MHIVVLKNRYYYGKKERTKIQKNRLDSKGG